MKVVLVDDEINALKMTELELSTAFPDLQVIGQFQNPELALPFVNYNQPELLIIDIEMPQMSGIDFVKKMNSHDSQVIFVTAYSNYAIEAIKADANDYLLKPLDSNELRIAVQKAIQRVESNPKIQLEKVLEKFSQKDQGIVKIPTTNGFTFVNKQDIIYCKSDSNYTHIYTTDKEILVSKTLKSIQQLLPEDDFLRVHHSFLVNLSHLKEYSRKDGGFVILSNNKKISVSNSRKDIFNK